MMRVTREEALKLCRERVNTYDSLTNKQAEFLLNYIDYLKSEIAVLKSVHHVPEREQGL
jgi:hypothetical protein